MHTVLAAICFTVSLTCLAFGVIKEYGQTRREPASATLNAMVPTLPWAVQGAMFVLLGLSFLPGSRAWWIYPLPFIATIVAFGYSFSFASARRKSR